MKTRFLVVLSVIVGIGLGVATAVYSLHHPAWDGTPDGLGGARVAEKPTIEPGPEETSPVAAVDQESYDFGVMDGGSKQSHTFVLTNKGQGKLTLAKGERTCRCTKFDLEKEELQPGQSAKVTLEWAPKGFRGSFRQTATVVTNDPARSRVVLTIVGRVTNIVKADPNDLVLDGVRSGENRATPIRVFAYTPKPLKILSCDFLDPDTAKYFTAKFEPMPEAQWKGEQDAQGGVVGEILLKSGLPVGSFRQTIHIKTNYGDAAEIEVPVNGTVVGEVSLFGADWNAARGVLTIGTVNAAEGAERTLLLIVRGEHRKGIKLEQIRSSPDLLQVEAGQPQEVPDRPIVQIPLTIRVPKGSPPASHLGWDLANLGRITIKTNHPLRQPDPGRAEAGKGEVLELIIHVRFAVRG